MPQDNISVLIVDDEPIRDELRIYLKEELGFIADSARTGIEALELVHKKQGLYDVAIIDQGLIPGPDGIAVMKDINAHYPEIECIIFTGKGVEHRQKALQEGASRYIEKPFDYDELAALISTTVDQARLRSIAREILSKRQLKSVLPSIAAAAKRLSLASEAVIVLENDRSGMLDVHLSGDAARNHLEVDNLKNEALSRRIMQTGRTESVPDTFDRPDLAPLTTDSMGFRSLVGVPIPSDEGYLGVLMVYGSTPNHLEAGSTVSLLQALATQAGIAIANAREYEHQEELARYMTALVETGRRLAETKQPDEQCQLAWEFVRDQLQASTFFVALLTSETGVVAFPLFIDEGGPHSLPDMDLQDPENLSITAHVLRNGEEIYWPTASARNETCTRLNIVSRQAGDRPCESCFFFPLRSGSMLIGTISIQAYEGHAFTPAQLDATRSLGNLLAAALENASLIEATVQHAADMETLQRLSQGLASTLSAQEVMEYTCQAVVEFFQADHSGFVLFDEQFEYGVVRVEFPTDVGTVGERFPIKGIPDEEKLIDLREPVVIKSTASQDTLGEAAKMLREKYDVQSTVFIPVTISGQVVGSFSLDAIGNERSFTELEVELCQIFADQAAVAFHNAQLYEESLRLRAAAEDLANAKEIKTTLDRIVENARKVLQADSTVLWPYDDERGRFIPEELATAGNISIEAVDGIRDNEPNPGQTTSRIMKERYVPVPDVSDPELDFIGKPTKELFKNTGTRSFQGISLRVGDKELGVLYANYLSPKVFTDEDQTRISTFASQAAVALQSARLFEQLQRTQQAAAAVAQDLTSQPLVKTLETITREVRKVLDADIATIYAYNTDQDLFTEWAWNAPELRNPDSIQAANKLNPETSAVYRIIALTAEPYYAIADVNLETHEVLFGRFCITEEVRASIGIQLRVNDQKAGVMFVNFRRELHRFTEDEISIVRLFANEAAIAIRNAQLYEKAKVQAEQLEIVAEIGRAVSSNVDLNSFLDSLFGRLKRLFGDRRIPVYANLGAYDARNQTLEMFETPYYPALIRERVFPISKKSIMARVARDREEHYAPNVLDDENYNKLIEDTRSEYAVPVFFGEVLLGVLDLESPVFDAFKEEDRALLRLVADQIASAWHTVQQYVDLRQAKTRADARTALAWMGMIASVYRHEMNSSATVIRGSLELIRDDLGAQPDPRITEHLDRVEQVTNRILDIPIAAPLSPDEGVESVLISQTIQGRLEQLQVGYRRLEGVLVEFGDPGAEQCTVRAHPEWLVRLLDPLVMNAAEAMASSSDRRLAIRVIKRQDRVEVQVEDTGHGIPDGIIDRLFTKAIEKKKGEKGLGVSLLMAQVIAQTYGGDIYVDRDHTGPTGTRMVFWFPLEAE